MAHGGGDRSSCLHAEVLAVETCWCQPGGDGGGAAVSGRRIPDSRRPTTFVKASSVAVGEGGRQACPCMWCCVRSCVVCTCVRRETRRVSYICVCVYVSAYVCIYVYYYLLVYVWRQLYTLVERHLWTSSSYRLLMILIHIPAYTAPLLCPSVHYSFAGRRFPHVFPVA